MHLPKHLTAPEADGKSATGCMTTALAQIMRYHKHPQRGQGSIFMEVKRGITHDDKFPNLVNTDQFNKFVDLLLNKQTQ